MTHIWVFESDDNGDPKVNDYDVQRETETHYVVSNMTRFSKDSDDVFTDMGDALAAFVERAVVQRDALKSRLAELEQAIKDARHLTRNRKAIVRR